MSLLMVTCLTTALLSSVTAEQQLWSVWLSNRYERGAYVFQCGDSSYGLFDIYAEIDDLIYDFAVNHAILPHYACSADLNQVVFANTLNDQPVVSGQSVFACSPSTEAKPAAPSCHVWPRRG